MQRMTLRAGALLVVLALLAGCGAFGAADPDPAELRESVNQTNASLDSYVATYELTVDLPDGNTTTTRAKLLVDRPNRVLFKYRAPDSAAGDRLLRNESSVRLYDTSENQVTLLGEPTGDSLADPIGRYVELLRDSNATYTGQTEGEDGLVLGYVAGDANVTLELGGGPGQSAYDIDSKTGNRTVWIDPDLELPVRVRVELELENRTTVATYRLSNVSVNPELSAEDFDLDIPDNATVEDDRNLTRSFASRSALADQAPFDVPEPTVPDGFTFEEATLLTLDNGSTAILSYTNATEATLTVSVSDLRSGSDLPDGERIEVAGRTVHLETVSGTVLATWESAGLRYSVSGRVDRETILAVVESIVSSS